MIVFPWGKNLRFHPLGLSTVNAYLRCAATATALAARLGLSPVAPRLSEIEAVSAARPDPLSVPWCASPARVVIGYGFSTAKTDARRKHCDAEGPIIFALAAVLSWHMPRRFSRATSRQGREIRDCKGRGACGSRAVHANLSHPRNPLNTPRVCGGSHSKARTSNTGRLAGQKPRPNARIPTDLGLVPGA